MLNFIVIINDCKLPKLPCHEQDAGVLCGYGPLKIGNIANNNNSNRHICRFLRVCLLNIYRF